MFPESYLTNEHYFLLWLVGRILKQLLEQKYLVIMGYLRNPCCCGPFNFSHCKTITNLKVKRQTRFKHNSRAQTSAPRRVSEPLRKHTHTHTSAHTPWLKFVGTDKENGTVHPRAGNWVVHVLCSCGIQESWEKGKVTKSGETKQVM